MNYRLLKKKLNLPAGFAPPAHLIYDDLVATAISRSDLEDDVRGINASLDLIRRTRGGPWPTGPLTSEFNFVDLVWHELEFREKDSFTYVLRDATGAYLGCCYLYPLGGRTELTEALLRYDVDISWWVTPSAYDAGYYSKAYRALCHWLATEYPFWAGYFSNREIPDAQ
jgi:RimJ/RimL family protein N-acetyltransferase